MAGNHGIDPEQPGRETFLALILTVFLGGGFVVFLIFVSAGFFFWVILISAGLGLLGCLHYLLWGRAFDRSVSREREEMELERQAEEWKTGGAPGERRF